MITRLRAENLKSWKDTGELRLSRLTGLFGTNSSGKTSILQILPMLKQTAEFPDRSRVLNTGNRESPVYLGTFQEVIHGRRADAALKLTFTCAPAQSLKDLGVTDAQIAGEKEIFFQTSIVRKGESPVLDSFEYGFGAKGVGMSRNSEGGYNLTHRGEWFHQRLTLHSQLYDGTPSHIFPVGAPIKCYGFPPDAAKYFEDATFLRDLQLAFENLMGKVHYLGPLRSYPERVYEWGGEKPMDAGWDGDQAIAALLASKTVTRVAEWLQKMTLIDSFSLEPVGKSRTVYECHVKISATATEVLLPDVGFGVSQILPVLVNCAMLPEDSSLLLEQPEIHLHPFAQAALADVLIDSVKERNIQVIVESHSEHLLRRIQRRIAEEKLTAEDAALYFCRLQEGVSEVEKLELDPYGYIKNWPEGFFGDEMAEVSSMTIAAMRQRARRK